MKRITIISVLFLLLTLSLNAQNLVSTDHYKRNVIIEEFTGIYCGYCPDGHKMANELAAEYQDRVFVLNVHAGGYAQDSQYDFRTDDGNIIYSGSNVSSFPSGNVNRVAESAIDRNNWNLYVEQQVEQMAECNVAGQVIIDKASRKATITVEVYYTANSVSETNYLNVVMLQDNIIAYQSGSNLNPSQVVSGGYRHMHAFRDAVTPTWGEAISPTTTGTFITKTYEYDIPNKIGSFDVNIGDIEFVTFVTEQYQGVVTRPVLNANKLHTLFMTNYYVHPTLLSLGMSSAFTCSNDKVLDVVINNSGVADLTSLKFEVTVDNAAPIVKTWEGSISSGQTFKVGLDLSIEEGTHDIDVKIVEANGVKYEDNKSFSVKKEGWIEMTASGEETQLTIELMQDKYGKQITWEILASDYSVIASGGPYENLSGSTATQLHEIKVNVPVNECVKFIIRDSKSNGICCLYGDGYYNILNSKGKTIVEGVGNFGAEASHVISIVEGEEEEPAILPAPTDVIAMTLNETELVVMWDAVDGAEGYKLYNQDQLIGTYEGLSTSVGNLKPGREYCFTVTAFDKNGESEKSEEACAKTKGEYNEEDDNDEGNEGDDNEGEEPGEGVEELYSSLLIYPNPVNDKLYIVTEVEIEEVVVYDIYGRQQSTVNSQQSIVDVSKLNSGIYFVRIKTIDEVVTKRIVKQ